MTAGPIWPLHPPPRNADILAGYVKRLAGLYDVSYENFCLGALGIPSSDRAALSLDDPSDEVLHRLSIGVGVSVDRLRVLRRETAFARVTAEIERFFLEHPECEQVYARIQALPYD